jgi:DNA invertase Pin-like site-specific DNA recombinase
MGKGPSQRQRAYREYVCSNRDKEEQEIREKMAKGAIGAVGFREQMGSRRWEISRVRSEVAQQLVRELGVSLAEVARLLGVSTSAISKILQRSP